ncbi:Protein MAINTENANCE OF MERISTEMS [Glycine soja]
MLRLPGLRKGSVVDRTYACNGYVISTSVDARQSATNVHVVYLEALRDLSQTGRYAWGVAALCWIYEHFPSVAESTADQDYNEDSPCAYRWIATKKTMKSIRTLAYRERLDQLRISDVCWIPYGEHRPVRDFHLISCYSGLLRWGPVAVYYRPERVVRQFGYTQTIPASSVDSWVSYDDIHDSWMHYSDHMVPAGEFFRISHPFMTPSQTSDPLPDGHALQPRVVPQAPQTDILHVPEPGASSTSARPAVKEPRHAVEVCYGIAKRLERHLSLGVVTLGSSTHEVIEECLRMAKSVTQDQLVYVRSRRRRRTDQA